MNESGRSTLSLEDKIEDLDHINKSHKKLTGNETPKPTKQQNIKQTTQTFEL